MDNGDIEDVCEPISPHVSNATPDSAQHTDVDITNDRGSSASTSCGVSADTPAYCWGSYKFLQNIKVEDELQESTEEDNAGSQHRHSVDGDHVSTGLESMMHEEQPQFNEQERIVPFKSTDQLSTWTDGINDVVTVKQEKEADADEYDGIDGEDTRRWFVCEAGVLREVTAGQAESVSPTLTGEDRGENVDERQQGSSASDTGNQNTQPNVTSVAGSSDATSCTKSRRLRIYDRFQPRAPAQRDLSTDDFSMTVHQTRHKKYSKRNELTLQYKLDLIKAAAESGKSSRQLANEFHIGRTQASRILKRKSELLREYEQSNCLHRKRGLQKTANKDVNVICWEWFQTARSLNIPVTGSMVQEKALRCARHLGNTEFKASNGWLESFRKRHGISFSVKCGVTADVSPETIDDWQQRIPSIIDTYKPEDVSKSDDAELFNRALCNKTLATKGQECLDGNVLNERMAADSEANNAGGHEERCLITSDEDALNYVGELANYGQQKNDALLLNMVADIKAHLEKKMSSKQRRVDC